MASPHYNGISSGMFRSVYWKRAFTSSHLAHRGLGHVDCTLDNQFAAPAPASSSGQTTPPPLRPPGMMKVRGKAYLSLPPQGSPLSLLTHKCRHICPWISYNNMGGVTVSSAHLLNTYKLTLQFQNTSDSVSQRQRTVFTGSSVWYPTLHTLLLSKDIFSYTEDGLSRRRSILNYIWTSMNWKKEQSPLLQPSLTDHHSWWLPVVSNNMKLLHVTKPFRQPNTLICHYKKDSHYIKK